MNHVDEIWGDGWGRVQLLSCPHAGFYSAGASGSMTFFVTASRQALISGFH